MKFNVRFECYNGEKLFISPPGKIGLDYIDCVREKFPEYELPLDVFSGYINCDINGNNKIYTLSLNEEKARKTGLFNGKNEVNVKVPSLFLSKYTGFKTEFRYKYSNDTTKWYNKIKCIFGFQVPRKIFDVEMINTAFSINEDILFEDWKKDGFPLKWNV